MPDSNMDREYQFTSSQGLLEALTFCQSLILIHCSRLHCRNGNTSRVTVVDLFKFSYKSYK